MKKLVFMFVAMAAISFAACTGGENKPATPEADTTAQTEVTDTNAVDTTAQDSANVQAPADSTQA